MTSPDSVWGKKQKTENEKCQSVEKPDMSIEGGGDWMNVDVTTRSVSAGPGVVDVCSGPLEIAMVLRKALDLQQAALSEGPVLKKKTQTKQILDQLETLERTAQQMIISIETWKATAAEIEMGCKDFNEV